MRIIKDSGWVRDGVTAGVIVALIKNPYFAAKTVVDAGQRTFFKPLAGLDFPLVWRSLSCDVFHILKAGVISSGYFFAEHDLPVSETCPFF